MNKPKQDNRKLNLYFTVECMIRLWEDCYLCHTVVMLHGVLAIRVLFVLEPTGTVF